MKSLTKYIIIAFGLLFVAVCAYAFILKRANDKLSDNSEPATVPVGVKQAIVKQFRDSLTKSNHTTFTNNAVLTATDLKKTVNKPLLDTISRALDIKTGQVEEWREIALTSQAANLKAHKELDSLKREVVRYKNNFIDLSYRRPDPNDTINPDGVFSYKYNAKVTISQYYKRRKVLGLPLGAKESFIDVASADTNSTVNGLRAFSVKQTAPALGLHIQALGSYNFGTKAYSPGVGAQFDFKRLSLTGAYYFNLTDKEVRPTVGVRYDLIRF